MPVTENNVGYSEHTELKMYNFRKIVEMHITMCQGIIPRQTWADSKYFYMDLTAGTGGIPDTNLPNCAKTMIEALRDKCIQFQAHLIDQHNISTLQKNLVSTPSLFYYPDDHNQVMKTIIANNLKKPAYGLMFYDPNAPGIINGNWPSLTSISELYRNYPQLSRVDFMMYLSATAIKRVSHLTKKNLQDWLATINKQNWVVRTPKGKWQWTFILGTNWDAYPRIKSIGFHSNSTPEGSEIFDTINFTHDELKKMRNQQLSFFDLIGQEN